MGSNKHNIKLPFIWMEWGPKAYKEYLKELDQWQKKDEATRGAEPHPRMLDKDVDNFLKLATALKIILGRSVRPQDIPRAKELLLSYLKGFFEVLLLELFDFFYTYFCLIVTR